jgi:hypothetical protein
MRRHKISKRKVVSTLTVGKPFQAAQVSLTKGEIETTANVLRCQRFATADNAAHSRE